MSGPAAGPVLPVARQSRLPRAGLAAAGVLAAGVICWAAVPLTARGAPVALAIAIAAGVMSLAQLAATAVGLRDTDTLAAFSVADRIGRQLVSLVTALPWAELMIVAVAVLEALHPARPWHTAVLGVALTGYLLAVHLAETRLSARLLRGQLPLLSIGVGLTALSAGAAALPGFPPGSAAAVVRIAMAVIAVIAAGLAIPVWLASSGSTPRGR